LHQEVNCDGQLLPISQNSALFSLLGTTFGGDGRTTFGLPDHRGRVALDDGQGPGLTDRRLGSRGGAETTSTVVQHNHSLTSAVLHGNPFVGDSAALTGNALALTLARTYSTTEPTAVMHTKSIAGTTDFTGSSSVNNMQPFVTLKCIIAIQGTFPSRS